MEFRCQTECERSGAVCCGDLYADDTVQLAKSEGMLQRIVDEFDRVCKSRKLKVNAGKIKVMVFKRAREQTINFAKPYKVELEAVLGCKIWFGKEKMEEVNEFKYLGTILCKHGSMEGEIRERTVKGRQVMRVLERVMKGRNVSIAVKKGIRNCVILPTLSYASETWTWNAAQQLHIRAVEMSYLWGVSGVSRWDRESNEDTYGRFGMSEAAVGVEYRVVEWVKRSTLRWYQSIN